MNLDAKLSEVMQLLMSCYQNKKTSLQLHNDLFARINTYVYLSQDPNINQYSFLSSFPHHLSYNLEFQII